MKPSPLWLPWQTFYAVVSTAAVANFSLMEKLIALANFSRCPGKLF